MQKKIIVILLAISSLVSTILLVFVEAAPDNSLSGLEELDEYIVSEFEDHLIEKGHYRTQTITIDSLFSRKVYRVRVKPGFSKTLFHLSLHEKLSRYEIDTPSTISLPDEDLHIHIYKDDTIIRSIYIRTDEELIEAPSDG